METSELAPCVVASVVKLVCQRHGFCLQPPSKGNESSNLVLNAVSSDIISCCDSFRRKRIVGIGLPKSPQNEAPTATEEIIELLQEINATLKEYHDISRK